MTMELGASSGPAWRPTLVDKTDAGRASKTPTALVGGDWGEGEQFAAGVRVEAFGERTHGAMDLVVLLSLVLLALGTWSLLADAGVPVWKLYASVTTTVLLALGALTRHPGWSASIRALTGGWIIAAPYLLNFAYIAPALWAYMGIGVVVTVASIPTLPARSRRRDQLAGAKAFC
jgi:hypothetical protein